MGTRSQQGIWQLPDLCLELTQCEAVLNSFHALCRQSIGTVLEIMQTAGKQCLGLLELVELAAPILGTKLSPDRHPVTLHAHALQPCCDPLCAECSGLSAIFCKIETCKAAHNMFDQHVLDLGPSIT